VPVLHLRQEERGVGNTNAGRRLRRPRAEVEVEDQKRDEKDDPAAVPAKPRRLRHARAAAPIVARLGHKSRITGAEVKITATLTHFFTHNGLPLLFVAVLIESFGVPLPGETALIAFGVLASQGDYDIRWVIATAAAGAIIGDNLGYWLIGRLGGRALFERWPWLHRYSNRVLPRGEALMARRGGEIVFFGRFVSVLRYTVAWIAGLSRMDWWKFLLWNAAGGIAWATMVALIAYYLGHSAGAAIKHYGLYAAAAIAAGGVLGLIVLRLTRRRFERRL
jgi:membrane protein DedA with SNARE-associated domain